mmetsp:Transcript_6140/g.23882  ORF Transcript_6140/g.23882 Transcript_6140/m.23882 type:complete len:327 (-) Transcript_6140:413-1393(-)
MLQDAETGSIGGAAKRVQLGAARLRQIRSQKGRQGREGLDFIDEPQIPQLLVWLKDGRHFRRSFGVVAEAFVLHRVAHDVGVVPDRLELKQRVIPRLRGEEQKAHLRDTEAGGDREGVKVGADHVADVLFLRIEVERHLVDVSVLRLQQVEEQVLLLVHRACDDERPSVRSQPLSPRNGRPHLRVALVLVGHPVLRHHQHSRRAPLPARHAQQQVRRLRDRFRPAPGDVVQAQVQLVVRQVLLGVRQGLSGGVLVRFPVVDLDGGEDGIVVAHVQRGHAVRQRGGLVRLQRTADREVARRVPIHHIHQLLLLHGRHHDRPARGIHG